MLLRVSEDICSNYFKVKSVVTGSANWELAQLQVADTVSQINPTNWTAEQ